MGFSTKHKAYSVVLGLAGAALITDKLFLRPDAGPAAAHAAGAAAAPAPAGMPGAAAARARAEASASELADRLRAAGAMLSRTPVNDAFLLPAAWREVPKAEAATAATAPASDEPAEITAARAALKLTGVVMGAQPVAVIDGMPYRPGETIGGLVLTEVSARSAHLRHAGSGTVLELRLADRPTNERSMRVSPRGNDATPEKPAGDDGSAPGTPTRK